MKINFGILVFFIASVVLVNLGCFTVNSNEHFTYEKLSLSVYDSLLKNTSDHYLIDVRTEGEYSKSHIPAAINFSFLAFHFKRDVKHLDRNKPVFVYCQTCHRSPLAARKLKKMGFTKVYDLKGGFRNWKLENYLEK